MSSSSDITSSSRVRISVVTPVYKGERFLEACVRSVRAQTVTDWEHVLVDDGSPDGSRAIADAAAAADRRVRVVAQPNGGVARARNRGIAAASESGEYVLLLDQDDLLEPDALERLGSYLTAHPEACAAFGPAAYCDEAGALLADESGWLRVNFAARGGRVVPAAERGRTFAHLLPCNPIATPGLCLIRREALRQAGELLDPDTAPCDDWDLYLRLVNATGKTIDAIGGAHVLRWRRHAENNSHDHARMASGERRVFAKYLSGAHGEECARIARAAYPFFRYGLRARACAGWAATAWRRRDYRDALLNGLRAVKYGVVAALLTAAGRVAVVARPGSTAASVAISPAAYAACPGGTETK